MVLLFLHGFISLSRNIYLTSTVGIAMFGYSNSFKITLSEIVTRIISICIFILTESLINAKECTYTYETKPEESKYTKQ